MRFVFWDEDTQVDFIHPGGKLYVPGAEAILPNLKRLTDWAVQHKILIVATTDAHPPDSAEFANWPPHCVVGTAGQQKVAETRVPDPFLIPNHPAAVPQRVEDYAQVILEKDSLDNFTNPNAEALLERIGKDAQIVLYGVVTEICVAIAARGLLDRGFSLWLVRDAAHHLDRAKGRAAMEEIERRGARLVTTDQVIGELAVLTAA
ncbi:MAG TPA: isochorismatase family cysteine hydrolase [Terriglobales bacterium]|nr:isochorismatase family cysteine hydrolase [Terriglobales bacterium]